MFALRRSHKSPQFLDDQRVELIVFSAISRKKHAASIPHLIPLATYIVLPANFQHRPRATTFDVRCNVFFLLPFAFFPLFFSFFGTFCFFFAARPCAIRNVPQSIAPSAQSAGRVPFSVLSLPARSGCTPRKHCTTFVFASDWPLATIPCPSFQCMANEVQPPCRSNSICQFRRYGQPTSIFRN